MHVNLLRNCLRSRGRISFTCTIAVGKDKEVALQAWAAHAYGAFTMTDPKPSTEPAPVLNPPPNTDVDPTKSLPLSIHTR